MTETLQQTVNRLNLSIEARFVPWSQSRNAMQKQRSLNWQVTLKRDGRDILTTDYSAGIAHCPSYKAFDRSLAQVEAIEFETETGKRAPRNGSLAQIGGKAINPNPLDVISSLALDSDVLNYNGFEDWADSFGYDSDSRKAETTYRACLEIALKLRNGLGESDLEALQQSASEY